MKEIEMVQNVFLSFNFLRRRKRLHNAASAEASVSREKTVSLPNSFMSSILHPFFLSLNRPSSSFAHYIFALLLWFLPDFLSLLDQLFFPSLFLLFLSICPAFNKTSFIHSLNSYHSKSNSNAATFHSFTFRVSQSVTQFESWKAGSSWKEGRGRGERERGQSECRHDSDTHNGMNRWWWFLSRQQF